MMMQKGFKVLVADDEYWIRENLKGLIDWREHSFELLDPVEDGERALASIREKRPDIVITDVNMPFISGVALIEKACKEFPETVFIALSGYSDYDYVRPALLAGALDYLLKPVSKTDLLGVLVKAVNRVITGRTQKEQQEETREKLRLASMSAADREFSELLRRSDGKVQDAVLQSRIAEYELDFSGFTLVVFRTDGIARILRGSGWKEPDKLIYKIKDVITSHMKESKNIVFNHIYKNNEFILITEADGGKLGEVCEKCAEALEQITRSAVTAIIGRHYFSFSKLREAYNDALFALLAKKLGNVSKVVSVADAKDCPALRRMNSEHERQLIHAVKTGNREHFKKILYEEIRLQDCVKDGWRYVETRQTAGSISWLLAKEASQSARASQILSLDNLAELLLLAADSFDIEEMNSILEQMQDEVFEPEDKPKQSESMRHIVEQVKEYIDANFFEDLSLTMLSELFLAESSYLSKAFRQAVGDNLMLYIAKARIKKAMEYLRNESLSITEISQLVGYGDYAYFSRVFRKITGASPRKYREGAD